MDIHIQADRIDNKSLASCLCISERAVRKRALNDGWPSIRNYKRGGRAQCYIVSGLPEDVRASVYEHIKNQTTDGAAAGIDTAMRLAVETADAENALNTARETGMAEFNAMPKKRQTEAIARLEILNARDAFLNATLAPKKRGTIIFIREYKVGNVHLPKWVEKSIGKPKIGKIALSWATLYRWERAYGEMGLAGLASGHKATRKTTIAKHHQDFIESMLVQFPHATIPHIRNGLSARFDGQAIPSDSAIRRFVAAWKKKNNSLYLYLTNPDDWRSHNMTAFGQADEYVMRLNQLWEFDSTPADVMLIDGRYSIIGVIDVYSRRAKLQLSPTSKSSAIAALTRRALLDWGVTESAKTDNGADYVSHHIVRVFQSLGIHQYLCTEFTPEEKPHIERFFGTFARDIVELLPGYIGHSVADRKAIEARRSFAQRLMKSGGDPVEINMTAEQFQDICNRWCLAIYEQNPHSGLNGKTPIDMVREWTAPVRRIQNERALDMLLLPAPDNHGMRKITKKGIKVERDYFIAPELGPHVGRDVFVLIDQADYGTIYIFLIEDDGSKTYLCKAVNPLRTGHDRAEIAIQAKALQKQVMAEGRKRLMKMAREMAVETIGKEILSYRERQLSNVREFPKQSEDYKTPELEQAAQAVEDVRREALGPIPHGITKEEEAAAEKVIDMAVMKNHGRPLPATAHEKYEQILDDMRCGRDVPDADFAFMKRYEIWLEKGDQGQL